MLLHFLWDLNFQHHMAWSFTVFRELKREWLFVLLILMELLTINVQVFNYVISVVHWNMSVAYLLKMLLAFLYYMDILCNISWDDILHSLCLIILLFYEIKLCLNKYISFFILWISTQHICIELNERKNGIATDVYIVVLWFEAITILKCNPRKSLNIPNI